MKYDSYYVTVDVETGGLPKQLKKKATLEVALTEVAFVVVSNPELEIVDKKSWLIKPYGKDTIYQEEAAKVSGITKQMLEKEGQEISQVFREICDFLKKYKKGNKLPIFVGHNLRNFDADFMIGLFEMFKTDISKFVDEDLEDTMEWMRKKFVEAPSFNLASCTQMANIDHVQAHRALPDTIATAKLWIYLLKCLRGEGVETKKKRFRDTFRFEF